MVGNNVLHANPSTTQIGLTTHASDWLWAVFAVMLISDLVFIAWALKRPIGARVFHQVPIIILTTATIAYFSMASDLGYVGIAVEFTRGHWSGAPTRSIWYVRYIDWTITTPLLLLELLLGTGLPLSDIVTVVFMDLVMIITGLVGSLVVSSYKWGYFTMGCFALFYIWWVLMSGARTSARAISLEAGRAYSTSAMYLSFLWLLYPIAWGLADGGNVISPTGEMIFYGVLDILAKPVFCFLHANALRRVSYEGFMLQSGKLSSGAGYNAGATGTAIGNDKVGRHGHNNGLGNNATGVNHGVNNGVNNGVGDGAGTTGIGGNGVGTGDAGYAGNGAGLGTHRV